MPSTVLPETVDDSAGAVIAPRETDPSTILPVTLLFEITDEWLIIPPFTMLVEIIDESNFNVTIDNTAVYFYGVAAGD
jgi:hypothetical protein